MFWNIIQFFLAGPAHVFHIIPDVLLALLELYVLFYYGIIEQVLGTNQYNQIGKQTEPSLVFRFINIFIRFVCSVSDFFHYAKFA